MVEIIKSIFENIKDRLSSRYLSYLTIILIVRNTEYFLITFDDKVSLYEKLNLIRYLLNSWDCLNILISFSLPIALIITIDYTTALVDNLTVKAYEFKYNAKKKRTDLKNQDEQLNAETLKKQRRLADPEKAATLLSRFPIDELQKVNTDEINKINVKHILSAFSNVQPLLDQTDFYDESLKGFKENIRNEYHHILDSLRELEKNQSDLYSIDFSSSNLKHNIRNMLKDLYNMKKTAEQIK